MEIIANDQGNHITTLYVAFTNEERLIGDAAKNRLRPPYGTVYDVNRSSAASSPTRRFSATRRWSISRSSTTPAQSLGMSVSLCVPLRPVPAPCAPAPCFFFGVNSERLLVLHLQHFTMHGPPLPRLPQCLLPAIRPPRRIPPRHQLLLRLLLQHTPALTTAPTPAPQSV